MKLKRLWFVLLVMALFVAMPFALAEEVQDTTEVEEVSDATETVAEDAAEVSDEAETAEAAEAAPEPVSEEGTESDEEEEEVVEADTETLQEELADEPTAAEVEEVKADLGKEAAAVSSGLPGGFSRFMNRVGDAFTFNKKAKAERALERVRENKMRILRKMQEKQSGLANAKKFAGEMQKLQLMIDADLAKAEAAVAKLAEEGSKKGLKDASELSDALVEQEALDDLVDEQVDETVAESEDLSSEDLAVLKGLQKAKTVASLKAKLQEKEARIAALLIANGKTLEEIKQLKEEVKQLRKEAKDKIAKTVKEKVKEKTKEKSEKRTEADQEKAQKKARVKENADDVKDADNDVDEEDATDELDDAEETKADAEKIENTEESEDEAESSGNSKSTNGDSKSKDK